MQKQDWVNRIESTLADGAPFVVKTTDPNKSPLLFAVDVFRRMNHNVRIAIEPTEHGKACLYVTVQQTKGYYEYTLRRDDDPEQIIESMAANSTATTVSVRACGTVLDSLFSILDWALHHGWYVDKAFMSTLTQTLANKNKQRNTAMNVVIHRGSNVDGI